MCVWGGGRRGVLKEMMKLHLPEEQLKTTAAARVKKDLTDMSC